MTDYLQEAQAHLEEAGRSLQNMLAVDAMSVDKLTPLHKQVLQHTGYGPWIEKAQREAAQIERKERQRISDAKPRIPYSEVHGMRVVNLDW